MEKKGIFGKSKDFINSYLDGQIEKAKGLVSEADKVSIAFDPWNENTDGYYKRKPARLSYLLQKNLARKDSILASIIVTRKNQIASFSKKQETKFDIGYVIELKDKDKHELEDKEKEEIQVLYDFISHCGFNDLIPDEDKMNFDEFLRRVVEDRLIYDQVAVEKVRRLDGKLAYFAPVDGSTIRHAVDDKIYQNAGKPVENKSANQALSYYDKKERKNQEYAYVQVIDETIFNAYTREDLIFKMANVTNDVRSKGYSVSEVELLIAALTNHLNAENYNSKQFTQGSIQKGLLHFKANITQRQLNMFKQSWYAQTTNPQNVWRTPIVAGMDEVKWVPLQQSNRDIEYNLWLEYNIKLICAIYLIDPSEINFDITQNRSEGNPLFTSKNEHKVKQSKDRGLRPLLRFIEDIMNEILSEVSDKYQFSFCGLDQDSRQQENERHKIEADTYKSINEVRSEYSLDPIELEFKIGDKKIRPYDLPLHPQAVSLVTQLLQMTNGGGSDNQGQIPQNPFGGASSQDQDKEKNQENLNTKEADKNTSKEPIEEIDNEMFEYFPEEDFGKAKNAPIKIEYFQITDN